MNSHRNARRIGFTLIEVLVVISIIALLLSILLPTLRRAKDAARIVLCKTQLQQWGRSYHSYAADFREFVGGATSELRDCYTSIYGGMGWYQNSPWGQSTNELFRYGVIKKITECPSRSASGYTTTTGDGDIQRDVHQSLDKTFQFGYVDYYILAGFGSGSEPGNPLNWSWNGGNPTWNESYALECWGFYNGYWQEWNSTSGPPTRGPVTSLRQNKSLKTPMLIDRSFYPNSASWYNSSFDCGGISNHVGKGPRTTAGTVPLADGANVLLLDSSVQWTKYSLTNRLDWNATTNPEGNYFYCRDYYSNIYLGANMARY
ncbi:MAG: prepilin-type N-terminal cleavage/methylation domain-containing protein [Phycisphaeraceae bacterium]|nr:prepilin-type N-terminal cleavage/methylation domain-containing protein [Phycisphaeraceae bacterium]